MKKSFRLSGHATSVALEPIFWDILARIAEHRQMTLSKLVYEIDQCAPRNLASALRVYVVDYLESGADS